MLKAMDAVGLWWLKLKARWLAFPIIWGSHCSASLETLSKGATEEAPPSVDPQIEQEKCVWWWTSPMNPHVKVHDCACPVYMCLYHEVDLWSCPLGVLRRMLQEYSITTNGSEPFGHVCVAGLKAVSQALSPVTLMDRISRCDQEQESVEFSGLRITFL